MMRGPEAKGIKGEDGVMRRSGVRVANEGRFAGPEVSEGDKSLVRRPARILASLIMALLSLAALEVLSYGYLRIVEGYDGEHLMNYEFDDYRNIRLTPNYRNENGVYHNAQGFRSDEDVRPEKAPGAYRIFIMGGSTAYGLGSLSAHGREDYAIIRNDETIDHYLERFLNDAIRGTGFEVINAAVTSYQSHHHLIYLNQTVLKYNPDMVVFIDGFNDYYNHRRGFDQWRDYAYRERVHYFMEEPTLGAWFSYTGWWLFRKSHLAHVVGEATRPVWLTMKQIGQKRARIDVEEALRQLHANAERNFVKMVERNSLILNHERVVAVFTLQPELVFSQSKTFTELEEKILDEMKAHWAANYVEYKNRARPVVIDHLRSATQRTGSEFIDLTDPFGGLAEDAYTDYCHLTPEGNERLAARLGEALLPIIADDMGNEKLAAGTESIIKGVGAEP